MPIRFLCLARHQILGDLWFKHRTGHLSTGAVAAPASLGVSKAGWMGLRVTWDSGRWWRLDGL